MSETLNPKKDLDNEELESVNGGGIISSGSDSAYILLVIQNTRKKYPQISSMSVSEKKAFLRSKGEDAVISILGDKIASL